jgi:hypothetical protein
VLRRASEWPEAQRRLREAVSAGAVVPRRPVHIVWWTAPVLLSDDVDLRVAVYDARPGPRDGPACVFPVAHPGPLSGAGEGPAVVVGEVGLNAVCGVELPGGSVVWPTYNPETGERWAPRPGAPGLASRRRPPGWIGVGAFTVVGWAGAWVVAHTAADPAVAGVVLRDALMWVLLVSPIVAVRWRLRGGR